MALFIQLFIWLELVWISRASFITTYSHSRRITYWKHIFYPTDILHASFFFQALLTPKWFFIIIGFRIYPLCFILTALATNNFNWIISWQNNNYIKLEYSWLYPFINSSKSSRNWWIMFLLPSVICTRCTGFFCLAIIKGSPNDIYFIIEESSKHYFTEKVSYSRLLFL